ncbi:MAG: AMP-binding protein [Prevotellaceae bacterium]|jgi:long-chain acyl-CoA synthetase|nr:AMP-binding protein [Prevotellaceae bacterium]
MFLNSKIKGAMVNRESFLTNIAASLTNHWDLPALTDYNSETVTYGQIARQIARLHIAFEVFDIKKGDKISIVGRNSSNWGISFLAAVTYGAVAVPILHEFTPENIHHIVNHSESKLLFTGKYILDSLDYAQMAGLEAIILIDDCTVIKSGKVKVETAEKLFDELEQRRYPAGFMPQDIKYHNDKPEELAMISYTSGTTGFSKGVMLPYRSLLSNMLFAETVLTGLKHGDNIVSILPLAHMYGLAFEFLYEIITGCHTYFLSRLPTPKIILDAFASVKPRIIITVPLIVEKIFKKQLFPAINKPFVRTALRLPLIDERILKRINQRLTDFFGGNFIEVIIGGAAFSPVAEKFLKRIGFKYTVGYGMTECGPIITYEDWTTVPLFSCGKAAPQMEIKIDSPDPENIPGEILTRGNNVMLGYYKNPEATKEAMAGGWLHTGDLGVIDKNGYLYIKGRSKNMLLGANGQNIYPEEIENRLNNTKYISESIVMDSYGKIVALAHPDHDAVSAENLSDSDLEELLDKARLEINTQLPPYSQISRIRIHTEEFEKTPKKSIKRYLYTK